MSGRDDVGRFVQALRRTTRSGLALVLVVGLVSMAAASALFLLFLSLIMTSGEVDAAIPPVQARNALARLLHGAKLDPDAKILDSHDKHGGLRGGGFQWFLVRLPSGRRSGFEADLLAAARSKLGSDRVVAVNAEWLPPGITQPLNGPPPLSRLPRQIRAWHFGPSADNLGHNPEGYTFFTGNQFYFYWQY